MVLACVEAAFGLECAIASCKIHHVASIMGVSRDRALIAMADLA